jgi:hypothetical protein
MSRSCIALLLFTCCALATQNLSAQKQGRNIRNIVLVHGAWADGSGWKGVYVSRPKEVAALIEEAASHVR